MASGTSMASMDCECNICMNKIDKNKSDYFTTGCNHTFHNKCLMQWIITNNTCPTCRHDIYDNIANIKSKKVYYIRYISNEKQFILPDDYDKLSERVADAIYVIDNNNSENTGIDNLIIDERNLENRWEIYDIDSLRIVCRSTIYTKKNNIKIEISIKKDGNKYSIEIELKYINKQQPKRTNKQFRQFKHINHYKKKAKINRNCKR